MRGLHTILMNSIKCKPAVFTIFYMGFLKLILEKYCSGQGLHSDSFSLPTVSFKILVKNKASPVAWAF